MMACISTPGPTNGSGQIQVIFGPMFSGKTTELMRRMKRYQLANYSCLVIKYIHDQRYAKDDLATHDQQTIKATPASQLFDVEAEALKCDVIGIDEGQFYPDIVHFCEKMADQGKTVIVAALDGTFQREAFGSILNLVPLAESVIKLTAVCMKCYGEGSFTKRKGAETELEVIGGAEKYLATCRACHKSPHKVKPMCSPARSRSQAPKPRTPVGKVEGGEEVETETEGGDMGNTHHGSRSRRMADEHQSKWKEAQDMKWGYGRDRGPDTWWVYYPAASGAHQSPINIDPEIAEYDTDLSSYPLRYCYLLNEPKFICNTGTGCQVNVNNRGSYVTGGPLGQHMFKLKQFHFHWGDKDDCGSEHTIHGKALSAELHLVHWNSDVFSSFEAASVEEGGLAVLAVLIKIGDSSNSGLDYLMRFMKNISYAGQSVDISAEFDVSLLLPEDLCEYWTYKGSLTTPPCSESVTWIVYQKPIRIHSRHVALFRELNSYQKGEKCPSDVCNGKILKNFRPIQAKGTRKIRTLQHNFMSKEEFYEQFHEQSLFTRHSEMKCQFQRQGLMD